MSGWDFRLVFAPGNVRRHSPAKALDGGTHVKEPVGSPSKFEHWYGSYRWGLGPILTGSRLCLSRDASYCSSRGGKVRLMDVRCWQTGPPRRLALDLGVNASDLVAFGSIPCLLQGELESGIYPIPEGFGRNSAAVGKGRSSGWLPDDRRRKIE